MRTWCDNERHERRNWTNIGRAGIVLIPIENTFHINNERYGICYRLHLYKGEPTRRYGNINFDV